MAWILHYLLNSFTTQPRWSRCPNYTDSTNAPLPANFAKPLETKDHMWAFSSSTTSYIKETLRSAESTRITAIPAAGGALLELANRTDAWNLATLTQTRCIDPDSITALVASANRVLYLSTYHSSTRGLIHFTSHPLQAR
ncbi:unnamed protein product [Protopolystoma xenopodis]|uniref:Uncharacterized protein n=1 Tax=Protopolystoma xenopodis TaxID=117903 RepID=A0A448X6N7_9PLAT|nr:unnamed protein product [Protopolystoma xenopodis]